MAKEKGKSKGHEPMKVGEMRHIKSKGERVHAKSKIEVPVVKTPPVKKTVAVIAKPEPKQKMANVEKKKLGIKDSSVDVKQAEIAKVKEKPGERVEEKKVEVKQFAAAPRPPQGVKPLSPVDFMAKKAEEARRELEQSQANFRKTFAAKTQTANQVSGSKTGVQQSAKPSVVQTPLQDQAQVKTQQSSIPQASHQQSPQSPLSQVPQGMPPHMMHMPPSHVSPIMPRPGVLQGIPIPTMGRPSFVHSQMNAARSFGRGGDRIALFIDIDNTGASLDNLMEVVSHLRGNGSIVYGKLYGYTDDKIAKFEEFVAENRLETIGRMRFKQKNVSVADPRLIVDVMRLNLINEFDSVFIWTGIGDLVPLYSMIRDKGTKVYVIDLPELDTQNRFVTRIKLFSLVNPIGGGGVRRVYAEKSEVEQSQGFTQLEQQSDNQNAVEAGITLEDMQIDEKLKELSSLIDDSVDFGDLEIPKLPRIDDDVEVSEPKLPSVDDEIVSGNDVVTANAFGGNNSVNMDEELAILMGLASQIRQEIKDEAAADVQSDFGEINVMEENTSDGMDDDLFGMGGLDSFDDIGLAGDPVEPYNPDKYDPFYEAPPPPKTLTEQYMENVSDFAPPSAFGDGGESGS
ncbi:MAG: NYN domain-containing protein [Firmicutes bacterium]|nr:NYN domain-containing protein [Bacillota bacterium]